MKKKKFTDFTIIWKDDKAALIDPVHKVCLGVSRAVAENLEDEKVIKKLYPIWKQQAELQNRIDKQHKKINTLYLMVTRKCNMDCEFCAMNANRNLRLQEEINIEDVTQKVIPFLKRINPHKIIITGGEPLIKEKIQSMIEEIRQEVDSFMILQSNGLILNGELLDSIEKHIDEIDFSTKHMLESDEGEQELKTHIRMVQERGIKVVLSFIYEIENKEQLHRAIDIAAEFNTELLINIVAPIGRAQEKSHQILTDYEKIQMNLEIAEYIYKKNYIQEKLFHFMFKAVQVQDSCGAYGRVLAIYPEGDIYMCQCLENNKFKIGNVLSDDIDQLERAQAALLVKEDIKKSFCVDDKQMCKECSYRYLCGGKCPASQEESDDQCGFTKKMIEYRLFFSNNQDKKKLIEGYINYLVDMKKEYETGPCGSLLQNVQSK